MIKLKLNIHFKYLINNFIYKILFKNVPFKLIRYIKCLKYMI